MTPMDVRAKIHDATVKLQEEIAAVFGQAFASVADGLLSPTSRASEAKPAKSKPGRKAASPTKPRKSKVVAGKAKAPATFVRRTPNEIVKTRERVLQLIAANRSGLGVEQVNEKLGTTTSQLTLPLSQLLASGKIRKTGIKRATTYFAVA